MDPHFKVELLAGAAKEFESLPRPEKRRVGEAIDSLERDPRPTGSIKLRGHSGFRLRVGRQRVLYQVDDAAQRVLIVRIGPRKDVYRRLERILRR